MSCIVTCDVEGRIQTFDHDAEKLFGYAPEEVIGHKRVSVFSPGSIVLDHMGRWLKEARSSGEFRTHTVLLRKDGTSFPAEICVTAIYEPHADHKRLVGYREATTALPDVAAQDIMPRNGGINRILAWIVITRAPFLAATLMPVLVASAWAGLNIEPGAFPWGLFASALVGALCLQIAANTFNDYFDWRSGADPANGDYFAAYSGGSRAIEMGLITERELLRLALVALVSAALATVPILFARGPVLLIFGLVGAVLAYFYTAPPLRLITRQGLGELSIMLAFGPLLTAGTAFALTGNIDAGSFLVGLSSGIFAGAILWVNQFPDAEADAAAGKNHLLVTVGKKAGRWCYLVLICAAFIVTVALTVMNVLPNSALAMLLGIPLAIYATHIVFKHYLDRELVKASRATIQLHFVAGLLLAIGILWNVG